MKKWFWPDQKEKLFFVGNILFVLVLFFSSFLEASWAPTIQGNKYLPPVFFVVDKDRQNLFLFSNHSPLEKVFSLPCTTGQVRGDKKQEGDKKTPEGVYFLEEKLSNGLDYYLYGGIAFTLNYPNPVDRVKGKTGHGIWIHGRGEQIKKFNTQGCIAVNLEDISLVEQNIVFYQTPVVITKNFAWVNKEGKEKDFEELLSQIKSWQRNWREKSKDFFSLYSSRAYIEGKKSFSAFYQYKQNLFRRYAWIDVYLEDIRFLPGPDYKVSYFKQYFRSPSLTSVGIKRLYWQKEKNNWKIVGEEWRPLPGEAKEVEDNYLKLRRKQILRWLAKWNYAWQQADIEEYIKFYSASAKQGRLNSRKAIYLYKKKLWQIKPPQRVYLGDIKVELSPKGFKVTAYQEYTSQDGYKDKGRKFLTLIPSGSGFKIVEEKWKKIDED